MTINFDDTQLYKTLANKTVDEGLDLVADTGINSTDRDERILLSTSLIEDKNSLFQKLISIGADVNTQDTQGLTALHLAALHNRFDYVQALIDADADIESRDAQGNTPLWHAVMSNSAEVIEILKNSGASLKATNNHGVCVADII